MPQQQLRVTALLAAIALLLAPIASADPPASADERPTIVMMIAEPEYQTSETLPRFAEQFLQNDYRVEYVFEDPAAENVFNGIEKIASADVLLISVRRKIPPASQLEAIRRFIDSGKPVVGIRTASHAFSLRNESPAAGNAQWPELDAEVFGGNYTGHHANDLVTTVRKSEGAIGHPIAAGIGDKGLTQIGSLYKTSPLADGAQVILVGGAEGINEEPVAWTFHRADGGRSFYTSLGHSTDFENPLFQTLLRQAIDWAASTRFDPVVRNIEGWTVHIDPALLKVVPETQAKPSDVDGERVLTMLANHLQRISILVAEEPLAKLKTIEIWIEQNHPTLQTMQYHPSRGWLIGNGHDERLTKKVHIPQAAQLLSKEQMLKHPAVILHELAHGFHDQVLSFDHPEIIQAYDDAKRSKTYEKVLSSTGQQVRHYGIGNHKEYFAEGTEAFFYRNDFYPFVRAELREHDPGLHSLLMRIWQER